MSGVNKVFLIGRLGKNPEVKFIPSGQAVCNLSIATSETYKDKNEQQQERTEWHNIVVWGKTGENCGKFLQKGSQVYIEGKLQTRSWDKDGIKHYRTDVHAIAVQFLDRAPNRGGGEAPAPQATSNAPADDDIPF